jgi:hypothetical protein
MDDFNVHSLNESRNEWCSKLLSILTPFIIEGYKSIFMESVKICHDKGEKDKYLMTFQNFIQHIPNWNANTVENERKRIIEKSGCTYLEDLISCVHIIQLKLLTAVRVGQKQKKIDINIPKLDDFIHKVYISTARKIYKNVYLFQIGIEPLQIQKHNRELELIVQDCILHSIRDSIPVETILKVYMDESVEERVIEEVKEEIIHIVPAPAPVTAPVTAPIQTPIPIPAPIQREPVTLSYDEKSRPLEEELININIDDFDNDDKPLELLPDLLSEDDLHITEYN